MGDGDWSFGIERRPEQTGRSEDCDGDGDGDGDWICGIESGKGTRMEKAGPMGRPEQIGRSKDGDGEMSEDLTSKRTATASESTTRMDSFRVDGARVFG